MNDVDVELFPLSVDQREELYRLSDEWRAIHDLRHIPAFEDCADFACRMARIVRCGL